VSWFGSQPGDGVQTYISRHGKEEWDANFLLFDRFAQTASLPLQYVFADHYQLDVLHVDDEFRELLGRLGLTVFIDAYSRAVTGLFLSYEAPNIESIQGGLRNAIWPKTDLDRFDIDLAWNCYGIPHRLFLDNAWAHHSLSLEDLVRALACGGPYTQMELVFRPPYQARYGGLVERLFGNLSGRLRELLPGAVLQTHQRRWHNASQGACLLYRDVVRLVHQMMVDYMHTPHQELQGLTPHEMWLAGLQLMMPVPPPLTPQLERSFWRLYPGTRVAANTGLSLFGLHYWGVNLAGLRGRDRNGRRRRFHLRYDPDDIRRVAVFEHGTWLGDGYAKELRLPDGRYESVSLWELILAKDLARQINPQQTPRPHSWLIHLLEAREHSQAALRFLLDPDIALVKLPNQGSDELGHDLAKAIGLKFRYLRIREGYSVTEVAQRMGVHSGLISALEHGVHPPLLSYLAYLETLSFSWPEFAALEIPPASVQEIQQPSFMVLRQCPVPSCPNHQSPPTMRVQLLADLPHQQKLRFRCRDCGLRFTLTYDGARVTKPRKPALQPNEPHLITKSTEEVNQLIEMGQQGMTNRQIARCLGWGEKTVRIYWIALGLEDEVHQAQAKQRTQEQQQRHAIRRAQIEAVMHRLLQEDAEITLRRLGRELGLNSDYLHTYPDLAEEVSEQIQHHNAEVRQRRYERLAVQTAQFVDAIRVGNDDLTFGEIAQQMGFSLGNLRKLFPQLHALIREAQEDRRIRLKTLRTQRECAQINEAAARLVANGSRLKFASILREAGLSKYRGQCDPVIHDLLQQWVGGFAPRA
jgi:transposase